MKQRISAFGLSFLLIILNPWIPITASAATVPLATASPLTGMALSDNPIVLPVVEAFQMALQMEAKELGRKCGKMEAYGWHVAQSEQLRVNQAFNAAVASLDGMGYVVDPKRTNSVSKDVTLFTADRADRQFIFLWSAGQTGLVAALCETTPGKSN